MSLAKHIKKELASLDHLYNQYFHEKLLVEATQIDQLTEINKTSNAILALETPLGENYMEISGLKKTQYKQVMALNKTMNSVTEWRIKMVLVDNERNEFEKQLNKKRR